jgi:GNAT superfamily N-acetyltransferase
LSITLTQLTDPDHKSSSHRLAWLASDTDANPVGSAYLRLFTTPGQAHLAELELTVHPTERRKGVGSRLLDAAVGAARDREVRTVVTDAAVGSAGDQFLPDRGFQVALTLMFARLPLAEVDDAVLAAITRTAPPGYRLDSWPGVVPDHLAQTFADWRRAMDDMPMGDTDYGPEVWDVDRVRSVAEVVERRGDLLTPVAVVEESSGKIVGFTELVVPGDGRGDAQHYGTGVLPEHRGHGLARWIKAESIRQARDRHPELGGLLADTADSNQPMRRINDALGYRPTHQTRRYQLDLRTGG